MKTHQFVGKALPDTIIRNVRRTLTYCAAAIAIYFSCAIASAINITLQYPAGTLFSATHDSAAKAAINQAAADVSAAITSNLAAINTDVFTGVTGGTTVSFDWSYEYTNPSGSNPVTINSATIPANSVTLFVGSKNISGDTLGHGGPAGAGYQLSAEYNGIGPFSLASAMASAASQSQSALRRGGGPKIANFADSITLGPQTASFSIDVGIAYGSLALDWNGSGDGGWHFNHTTEPASGKNDLYSVALHEILHALGIGSSQSWEEQVSGTSWTGTNVINLLGSGAGILNSNQDHIASATVSTDALTGLPQEAAMTPEILTGTRKRLTALDLAFLRDIGYSTIDWVTQDYSPADFNTDGFVDGADLLIWRNSYGVNQGGDTNDDGDTDGRDFLVWQREYTGSSAFAGVTVPEPSAALLLSTVLVLLGHRRIVR